MDWVVSIELPSWKTIVVSKMNVFVVMQPEDNGPEERGCLQGRLTSYTEKKCINVSERTALY